TEKPTSLDLQLSGPVPRRPSGPKQGSAEDDITGFKSNGAKKFFAPLLLNPVMSHALGEWLV
ncbi:MAG: hypothetical protein MK125_08875, partial [Dehalococcoidia bacterium]|nr:hypothetical protein [Dehalococcoidia bacterium]